MRSIILKFCFLSLLLAVVLIACSDEDKSVAPVSDLPVVAVGGTYPAGSYSFCYDQTDASGTTLHPGTYQVVIEANVGYSVTRSFTVRAGEAGVPTPDCGDTPITKHEVPSVYAAWLNDSVYAPGDTLAIRVDLPMMDSVVVTVQ